ncbi:MAG: NAD(P)/FAD-dependent oxidoreductase [Pseudomonadota bacterium]
MIPRNDPDILVVGAGPAGSSAAVAAAGAGLEVLLIEAKARIGERPHCGEFVPRKLFEEFHLDNRVTYQPVEVMETHVLSGDTVLGCEFRSTDKTETFSPGFIIDRARFDRTLARDAAWVGAVVVSDARLVRKEGAAWVVCTDGSERRLHPKLVIAADGAFSAVAAALGLPRPDYLHGVQVEVPLVRECDRTFVLLHRDIRHGYAWLFPKGRTANVGLGVSPGDGPGARILLDRTLILLESWGMIRRGRLAVTSGIIPVSGLRKKLVVENAVFCGDAAGLTHPITGAGIAQAVFSGTEAGLAAAKAVKSGEAAPLEAYEHDIFVRYKGVTSHAAAKRKAMEHSWDLGDLSEASRQWWIAFKGYRRRVR